MLIVFSQCLAYSNTVALVYCLQFEKLIDEATGKKDFQSLEQFLATEECENVSHKCSKQFVNKLDKLLCWVM